MSINLHGMVVLRLTWVRLRQVDVKAEHFERQVTRVEQERDEWERKHGVSARHFEVTLGDSTDLNPAQEAVEKYQQSKRELDEVVQQMESLVSDPSCIKAKLTTSRSVIFRPDSLSDCIYIGFIYAFGRYRFYCHDEMNNVEDAGGDSLLRLTRMGRAPRSDPESYIY